MPATPNLQRLTLPDQSTGQTQFVEQAANLPAVAQLLQSAANTDNAAYQKGISAVDPNLTGNIGSVDELARLYGLGAVSNDTRQAINRSNAYSALQGGFRAPDASATGANAAPGSSMMAANNAVQVGQTALNEQNAAPGLTNEAAQASLALNPTHVDVGSTLISPAALLSRADAAAYYNNNLDNQINLLNAGSQAKASQQAQGSLFSGLGSILGGSGGGSSGGGGGGLMGLLGSFGGGG